MINFILTIEGCFQVFGPRLELGDFPKVWHHSLPLTLKWVRNGDFLLALGTLQCRCLNLPVSSACEPKRVVADFPFSFPSWQQVLGGEECELGLGLGSGAPKSHLKQLFSCMHAMKACWVDAGQAWGRNRTHNMLQRTSSPQYSSALHPNKKIPQSLLRPMDTMTQKGLPALQGILIVRSQFAHGSLDLCLEA